MLFQGFDCSFWHLMAKILHCVACSPRNLQEFEVLQFDVFFTDLLVQLIILDMFFTNHLHCCVRVFWCFLFPFSGGPAAGWAGQVALTRDSSGIFWAQGYCRDTHRHSSCTRALGDTYQTVIWPRCLSALTNFAELCAKIVVDCTGGS